MQSPRITRLLADPSPGQVNRFWRDVTAAGTPLVEPGDGDRVLVTFLWRGEARSARAWWGVDVPLSRLPGTDLWHGSELLPADLRTIYCLRHDDTEDLPGDPGGGGPSHVDAHNPRRFLFPRDPQDAADRDRWASVLELPRAPAERWTAPLPGVEPGPITEAAVPGAALGGPRPVAVYRPAGTDTTGLPVLVVFDGFLSRTVLRIPTVLDNLIAAGRIPPVCALFVSNFHDDRERELTPAPAIADFVVHELMPWARETLRTSTEPGVNLITGASRGGLIAAYLGLSAPEIFGAVVAQSGSFWWPSPGEGRPGWLIREVTRRPRADVRFALDVGVRENRPGPGGAPSQIAVNRWMRDALRARGYQVDYAEHPGGHDHLTWRNTFADGLLAVAGLFATDRR